MLKSESRRRAATLILSESSAARYAFERGFATGSDILNGNVVVTGRTGRHKLFLLENRVGTSVVFKQATDSGRKALEREATLYDLLWSSGSPPEIPIPTLFSYDRANSILVLGLDDSALDLAALSRRTGRISLRTAAAIGTILARLHEHAASRPFADGKLSELHCASPFAFFSMLSRIEALPMFSAAEVQVIKIIHADSELSSHLRHISSKWRSDAPPETSATLPGRTFRRRTNLSSGSSITRSECAAANPARLSPSIVSGELMSFFTALPREPRTTDRPRDG